jgi:hypothetical protein
MGTATSRSAPQATVGLLVASRPSPLRMAMVSKRFAWDHVTKRLRRIKRPTLDRSAGTIEGCFSAYPHARPSTLHELIVKLYESSQDKT